MSNFEKRLAAWQDDESDVLDLMVWHFESRKDGDWIEVADESRRLLNLMFNPDDPDMQIQPDSAMDGAISGIAVAGWNSAIRAVAEILGCDAKALDGVISDFASPNMYTTEDVRDGRVARYIGIGCEKLLREVADHRKELDEINARMS